MFTQIDELNKDRHLKASFTEFLEALVRVIDKASLEPVKGDNESIDSDAPKMSNQERKEQPLHIKIENTIPYLMSICGSRFLDTQFFKPQKDETEDLYILANGKFF